VDRTLPCYIDRAFLNGWLVSFFLSFKGDGKKDIQSLIGGVHLIRPTLSPVARLFFEVNKTKEISRQRKFPWFGTYCGVIQVISLLYQIHLRSGNKGEILRCKNPVVKTEVSDVRMHMLVSGDPSKWMHARVVSETDARKGLLGHRYAKPERPC